MKTEKAASEYLINIPIKEVDGNTEEQVVEAIKEAQEDAFKQSKSEGMNDEV